MCVGSVPYDRQGEAQQRKRAGFSRVIDVCKVIEIAGQTMFSRAPSISPSDP